MGSFAAKIISDQGHLVHRVRGTDHTGRTAYYFVLVQPHKEDAFLRALKTNRVNLTDYGQVIASCYGEEPTAEIKTMLREEYGFDV